MEIQLHSFLISELDAGGGENDHAEGLVAHLKSESLRIHREAQTKPRKRTDDPLSPKL